MPSPFPGMNPYLEQPDLWQQFHGQMMPLFLEQLVVQVRPRYTVHLEEYVYIHELPVEDARRAGRADLSIESESASLAVAVAPLEAPAVAVIDLAVDQERWSYLEIRDRKDRHVVTVMELLSPSNKRRGDDRKSYLAKRRELLSSPINFIELDLLRGGPRMPFREQPNCDYYALVSRPEHRPRVGFWPIALADLLPRIPIPLGQGDADAELNLQDALHRAYDAAGYEDYIYSGEPEPPLTPEQAEWAKAFIPPRAT